MVHAAIFLSLFFYPCILPIGSLGTTDEEGTIKHDTLRERLRMFDSDGDPWPREHVVGRLEKQLVPVQLRAGSRDERVPVACSGPPHRSRVTSPPITLLPTSTNTTRQVYLRATLLECSVNVDLSPSSSSLSSPLSLPLPTSFSSLPLPCPVQIPVTGPGESLSFPSPPSGPSGPGVRAVSGSWSEEAVYAVRKHPRWLICPASVVLCASLS